MKNIFLAALLLALSTVAPAQRMNLNQIQQIGANSVLGNATGSTGNITVLSIPSCSATNEALNYTLASGWSCQLIPGSAGGTVTTFSCATANGVSCTVSNATSTPQATYTLGAITPTTVNGNTITTGSGTLTLGAGKTLTASNTLTFTATDGSTLAVGGGGTLGTAAYTAATAYATSTQGTTADNAMPKAGGTFTGNVLFTDATYDIGASGATRPRHLYLSGNGVIGGTLNVTGAITGNLTGNASGTAATVTNATQAAITTAANLTTVGALDAGSITSGFGSIDVGADAISGGTITGSGLRTTGTSLVFQQGGVTGTINWAPATSNKAITLPNGTTDFTATGGTSQFVKQASAGAAFTVARPACADLSDSSTGCTTTVGTSATVNTGTSGATIPLLNGTNTASGAWTFTSAAPQLTLGVNTTTLGSIKLFGSTSGDATVQPAAVAGAATVVTLPNASSTLPIFGQQITFSGPTAARTVTFPDANFTVARTDAANTFTGVQTMTSPAITTPAFTGTATGTYTLGGTPTLGAATLGGTLSGGGNQINNVIIGTSTPLAGAFTTLTASTSIATGTGTTTTAGLKLINGTAGVASGYGCIYPENVTPAAGNYALCAHTATAATIVNAATGGHVYMGINNGTTVDVTAAGVAVTGTLTTTGAINKVTVTAPATGSTLTIADGKTLTVTNDATILRSGGGTVIDSGNLPAAATKAITIPAGYNYLVIQTTGWSQATNTARIRVRVGTAGSADATAGNYVGNVISGTTVTNFTTNALASMTDCTTQTTAQTGSATVTLMGIAGSGHKTFQSRVLANTTECLNWGTYIGSANAIDTVEFSTSAAGNFDAGTYAVIGY